jgi:hypothetical protein
MADVIAFEGSQREGNEQFLCCPLCEGDEFTVILDGPGVSPTVIGLVCFSDACDGKIMLGVDNGRLPPLNGPMSA